MGKKWERFKHFDEGVYWREICDMSRSELQAEHKNLQISGTAAAAGAGGTAVAGFFTLGVAWALTGVNARRMWVTEQQLKLVRRRLVDKGWDLQKMTKRDAALAIGPALVGEMIVPAGGAVLGHATHHLITAGGQHAMQAAGQHAVQNGVQHAAQNIVAQAPMHAVSACAHHTSTFLASVLQGAQSEIFTNSAGALGHASAQYFSALPIDLATAQSEVLGSAAGQLMLGEAVKHGLSYSGKYATEQGIKSAIRSADKKGVAVSVSRRSSSSSVSSMSSTSDDTSEVLAIAAASLLNAHYKTMGIYDFAGFVKHDIQRIAACTVSTCSCGDYDDKNQAHADPDDDDNTCLCGHGLGSHSYEDDGDIAFMNPVTESFSKLWYGRFEHREHDGRFKTELGLIEPCEKCDCMDYDRGTEGSGEHKNCTCGCGWGYHRKQHGTDKEKRIWVVGVVTVLFVGYLMEV